MSCSKENTVLIQATTGFAYEGSKAEGYQVYHPYKGKGLLLRVLREICFRIRFLPKAIWYNKEFIDLDIQYFIVWDVLITKHYLQWLRKKYPSAQINYKYANMVGKAKNLVPEEIPKDIRVWTYDKYDSEKYGIHLYKSNIYFPSNVKPLKAPQYDVFFIGKDKGRGDWLVELEKKLQSFGLRTKFIITADGVLSKRKPYYQNAIPYSEITKYLSESKAVLNVVMENQQGITVRDMESVFFGIKLITTNKHITEWEMYDPNNVFVIHDEQDLSKLVEFLNKPVHKIDPQLLSNHTMAGLIEEITRA